VYNLWLKATWPTTWQINAPQCTCLSAGADARFHGNAESHVCSVATYIGALAVEHSRSGLAKSRSCACDEVRFTAARRHVSGLRHLKPARVLANNGMQELHVENLEPRNLELGTW